jgi:hypothetical protein
VYILRSRITSQINYTDELCYLTLKHAVRSGHCSYRVNVEVTVMGGIDYR